MHKPAVAAIGEILWDIYADGTKTLGGAPLNCLYNAVLCGANGIFISAVGDDFLGEELLAALPSNISYIIDINSRPTGKVIVALENGSPSYVIEENSAWDNLSNSFKITSAMENIDAISFGTLACRNEKSRDTIANLLKNLPSNVLKFYDMNLRFPYYSKEIIETLLSQAHILKLNDEELAIIGQIFGLDSNHDEVCRFLFHKYCLKYIALTCGADHSIIYSDDKKSFIQTPSIKVVDTIGAGDAFAGAFLYWVLIGETVENAHEKAIAQASIACLQKGAFNTSIL